MISLRAFQDSDVPQLVELANNDRVTRYLRDHFPRPYTTQDAKYWVEDGSSDEQGQHFAICLDGDCIGSIGVYWGKGEFQCAGEVGYWLGEPFWGNGYASDALALFTEWLVKNSELQRFYALVITPNRASMRVLEKNGYELEGIHRRAVCKRGVLYDEFCYARIRE